MEYEFRIIQGEKPGEKHKVYTAWQWRKISEYYYDVDNNFLDPPECVATKWKTMPVVHMTYDEWVEAGGPIGPTARGIDKEMNDDSRPSKE